VGLIMFFIFTVPTVLQILTESLVDNPAWSNYVPDDTDQNQDGQLSEEEVEKIFREYWDAAAEILDKDNDGFITSDEIRSVELTLPNLELIWNLATETYPLKYWFKIQDIDGNGLIAREDFRCGPVLELNEDLNEGCWEEGEDMWNKFGKYFLAADENGDEEVSLEEIRDKAFSYLGSLFNLVDQNDDGSISIEDFSILRIGREKLITVISEAFNNIYLDGDEAFIDWRQDGLYDEIVGHDQDGNILNQLSRSIHKNPDGKVELGEVLNFVNNVFSTVDQNDDNYVTIDDVFKTLKNNGATPDQVDALQAYMEEMRAFAGKIFTKMADHFLEELDENADGRLSKEELYSIRADFFQERGFYNLNFGMFPEAAQLDIDLPAIIAGILEKPPYTDDCEDCFRTEEHPLYR